MKITAVVGSPHGRHGTTGRLLEEVLAGLDREAQVELIELSLLHISPCHGCNLCHKVGRCFVRDDFEPVRQALLASDGFILASPNYVFSVSAQLKALFDRCCGIIHCLALEGKYGAVVETSGSGEDDEVIRYIERFVNATGAQSVGGIGGSAAGVRALSGDDLLLRKAQELGRELCRCIREKEHFPDQAGFRGTFKARMKRLVEQKKDDWSFEYQYWQERHTAIS